MASGSDEGEDIHPGKVDEMSSDKGPDMETQRRNRKKKLDKLNAAADKREKPAKVKHLLSPYGEIGRLYLAPEDASLRKDRKRKGGNSGKEFTEGWVEFEDKRVAKQVAQMLNGKQMDPKRRSAFHYDLWCLKYLPKFKWHHLTEDIAYQRATREQRMAFEISNAKRERDFYLKQVGQSKAIAAMKERKRKKADADPSSEDPPADRKQRDFRQREAKPDPVNDDGPSVSRSMLGLIVGKSGPGSLKGSEDGAGTKPKKAKKKRASIAD
eukprot:CAMPEP_0117660030 /NCGR_PEP_ID=MMETSP0804-20121206/6748_1 /TAXON_ID=1074897 /ORGANISM="Tetraselmis astigmatica, Strain CCMP880" /LENGTH=267 /DNA_ID=CAMNT_0005466727 /DNA_START=52 /DNA_END=855 /DNA_ORIENTATION=+